jgi:hypothetical protein
MLTATIKDFTAVLDAKGLPSHASHLDGIVPETALQRDTESHPSVLPELKKRQIKGNPHMFGKPTMLELVCSYSSWLRCMFPFIDIRRWES